MTLPHNVCYTPMFMPVGTQGAPLQCLPALCLRERVMRACGASKALSGAEG